MFHFYHVEEQHIIKKSLEHPLPTRLFQDRVPVDKFHVTRLQQVEIALQKLRDNGCVVCFAMGAPNWRYHALPECLRNIATEGDGAWKIWRAEELKLPAGNCWKCCVPQNVSGGFHEYQPDKKPIHRYHQTDRVHGRRRQASVQRISRK